MFFFLLRGTNGRLELFIRWNFFFFFSISIHLSIVGWESRSKANLVRMFQRNVNYYNGFMFFICWSKGFLIHSIEVLEYYRRKRNAFLRLSFRTIDNIEKNLLSFRFNLFDVSLHENDRRLRENCRLEYCARTISQY